MQPLVSVVMPAYNAEKTIGPAIRSILGQTYQNFELIIVDDASKDRTVDIVKSFSDPRIVLLRNKKNLKAGPSFNIAIENARGEYIASNDADDISMPNRLEKQVNFLIMYPEIDVVGSNAYVIDNAGNILGIYGKGKKTHYELTKNINRGIGILFSTIMTKKEWFNKYKFRNYPRSAETDLFLRSYKYSKFYNLPDILYAWREPGKESNRKMMIKKMILNSLSQLDMRFRNWKEYGLPINAVLSYPLIVARKWAYWTVCIIFRKSPFARLYKEVYKDKQYYSDQEWIFNCISLGKQ